MTVLNPEYLYIVDEDLYRLGNATSSRLDNVRPRDVQTYRRDGTLMVSATGDGISLITEKRVSLLRPNTGWLWKLPARFPIPTGLALTPDRALLKPGEPTEHYFLCPASDMSLEEYQSLLLRLAVNFERVRKQ